MPPRSHVSAETRRLLEPERSKMGALRPPPQAAEPEKRAVETAVASALEASFRYVSGICAALGAAAAACGAGMAKGVAAGRTTSGARA